MKNIFILPTTQPSRLWIDTITGKLVLDKEPNTLHSQHVYITSDEEIKDGDWMIRGNEQPTLVTPNFFWDFGVRYYKIILTTDPTLITDGVQAIDDEFLEWLVKNPSCEFVEVNKKLVEFPLTFKMMYKITIPQETLEEQMYRASFENESPLWHDGFIAGGKYMTERMYSEEDLRKSFHVGRLYQGRESDTTFEGWFEEQFKKK
jgi:hypothetical protein